ncbi:MAG: hypothetical protein BWY82_01074 [Verrucomicrobia bacterium ADurb.Bin474]|nr:MAG: hypothetical protein BWY82_01074 [Verrucomicrobia bacterium ADurb.Bin474]
MVNHLYAFHRLLHNRPICNRSDDDLGTPSPDFVCLQTFLVIQGNHLMSLIQQSPDKSFSSESCSACNQYFHSDRLRVSRYQQQPPPDSNSFSTGSPTMSLMGSGLSRILRKSKDTSACSHFIDADSEPPPANQTAFSIPTQKTRTPTRSTRILI